MAIVKKMLPVHIQNVLSTIQSEIIALTVRYEKISETAGVFDQHWTGVDADAFKEELQTRFLPELQAVIRSLEGMPGDITTYMDDIERADHEGKVRALEFDEMCRNIIR